MKLLKISIIVPVYNCETFLHRCMDSLINQTLKDIEIICINDGSTDRSLAILQEYASRDSRIKIINKENTGQAAARNLGIDIATGEFLGFVDSDDWVDLDFFEKLYNAAKKHNTEMATAGFIRTNLKRQKYRLKYNNEVVEYDYKKKLMLCNVPDFSYVWNKIFNTAKFKATDIKFTEGRFYEDTAIIAQILYYLEGIVTVPDTYYYYLRREGSTITFKGKRYIDDYLWARKTARDFVKNKINLDLNKLRTIQKKYKLFGVTLLKISRKNNTKTYRLLNMIEWSQIINKT